MSWISGGPSLRARRVRPVASLAIRLEKRFRLAVASSDSSAGTITSTVTPSSPAPDMARYASRPTAASAASPSAAATISSRRRLKLRRCSCRFALRLVIRRSPPTTMICQSVYRTCSASQLLNSYNVCAARPLRSQPLWRNSLPAMPAQHRKKTSLHYYGDGFGLASHTRPFTHLSRPQIRYPDSTRTLNNRIAQPWRFCQLSVLLEKKYFGLLKSILIKLKVKQ